MEKPLPVYRSSKIEIIYVNRASAVKTFEFSEN